MMASVSIALACGGTENANSPATNADAAAEAGPEAAGSNACGGDQALTFGGKPASPADPCGPCRDGALVCADPNLLACVGALPASACADASSPADAGMDATRDVSTDTWVAPPDSGHPADSGAPVDSGFPMDTGFPTDSGDASDAEGGAEASTVNSGSGWQVNDAWPPVDVLTDGGLPSVGCIEVPTVDLVADPSRPILYASVSSTSAAYGNSVVRIDRTNIDVTGIVFVGSNPNALAVTDDGSSLYVGDDGTASVRRIDLASGGVFAPVYLGTGTFGPRLAKEILAVPGSPTRYVVSRRITSVSPDFAGLALYDGDTLLGEWNGFVGGESIAFAGPTTLYGYNNEDTGFDLFEFTLTSSGFQQDSDTSGVISGFYISIYGQGGWIFATNGQAVNGATDQPAGMYGATGLVWGDPGEQDVWYLDGQRLLDFDRNTFLLKKSITLPASAFSGGSPTSFVGWSGPEFAFSTPTSVCIVTP